MLGHQFVVADKRDLAARKGNTSTVSMVSSLWQHGPGMLEKMKQSNARWPRFRTRT